VSTSTPTTFPPALRELLADFNQTPAVRSSDYKEDWTRVEYIEPLFNELGWRRINPAHLTNRSSGYVREIPLNDEGSARAPDYGFYVDGRRYFYVEAKKPWINLKEDPAPAYQIRHYGWSAKDDVGIVTDFEEFAVYNCRVQPETAERPDVARIDYLTSSDFEARWPWLLEHFSPTAVAGGSLERLAQDYRDKKRLIPVDTAFLREIEQWREDLAGSISVANQLSGRELNAAVQSLIDRTIFLRIAEARGLESEGTLRATLDSSPVYPNLLKLFERADTRYNSGLFHFRVEKQRPEPDRLSPRLVVEDAALRSMIDRLTSPESPYRFSVLPTDILGQVYERFLGHEIHQRGNSVVIELKPEVRKSGGVYYTPQYIVDYIIDKSLGPLVAGKSLAQVKSLRVVDPSCGSGTFLLSAYQFLLDWHQERYAQYKRESDRYRYLMVGADGRLRLKLSERKRILIDNIFGVDIDLQAVEVAKLSLLLKVIEGETQAAFVVDRLLPDLDSNIVCGNSLIGSDFYPTAELIHLTSDEAAKVNPLDWSSAFPNIAAKHGFDAVVGNPPWLMAGYYVADSMNYFHRHYETCTGKADLYYLFLEKALRLVKQGGRIGMIVPSKLFHTQAAKRLRGLLSQGGWIEEIVDFGTERIFEGATNYSSILTMSAGNSGPLSVLRSKRHFSETRPFSVDRSSLGIDPWHLIDPERRDLWETIERGSVHLRQICSRFGNGVQSGLDSLLLMSEERREALGLEAEVFRPILKGKDVRRFSVDEKDQLIVFPYDTDDDQFVVIDEVDLRRRYPNTYAYLSENRQVLEKRRWFGKGPTDLSGAWYGMMFLDTPSSFSVPHLVTPALSNKSNFAMDEETLLFVTGTAGVSSVIPESQDEEFRYFILGALNSLLLSEFIIDHSTPYQGNYFKFSAPYIRPVPIRVPNMSLRSSRSLVSDIAVVAQALSTSSDAQAGVQPTALELRLNELVFELYQIDETARACLDR
jgi:hypothetical protein